jgi:MFS family permease
MTLPRGIWALGLVSAFMDISSEMIHGLLPAFLVTVIGASATSVGLIEGAGEGFALITRVFSGYLSDRLERRKGLIVSGYLLGTLTKPLFALAGGVGLVFGARLLDRFGKGLRGAPRDALIADLAPAHQWGAAYGLRQALDSVGAFVGPLLAVAIMALTADDFRTVFWLAGLPGVVAVAILVLGVREPAGRTAKPVRAPVNATDLRRLDRAYWLVLGVGIVFSMARFSEAFLLLRAEAAGLAPGLVPLVLVIISLVYALGAYPVGLLSDRLGRLRLLGAGLAFLILADLILAAATGVWQVAAGAALWGLHLAFTQGLFSALVADTSSVSVRGTAFGVYGLVTGVAVLLASVLAGWLWDHYGAPATFLTGALFSLLALAGFEILRRQENGKMGTDHVFPGKRGLSPFSVVPIFQTN